MADTTLPALLDTGTHAARPAASAVGTGALYSCTDHSLVYQTDGSSWTTWATLGTSSGIAATLLDAKGDLIAASAADTAARLAVGTNGHVLTADSGEATGIKWAAVSATVQEPWVIVPEGNGWIGTYRVMGAANRASIVPVTIPTASTIEGVLINVSTSSGNICAGLYNSSLARVATSGSTACPAAGPRQINFTGNYSAAAGRYYVAFSADNNTATFAFCEHATSGTSFFNAQFQASAFPLPDPIVPAGAFSMMTLALAVSGGAP